MELKKCINERRSIRKYADKPVSRETVIELIKAAQMAPSWKNSQVSRYYIAESSAAREEVLSALPEFNRNNALSAPVLIVTAVVTGRSGFERDGSYTTHLKDGFQYFDNGLQTENLCLKAYDEGLGTLIMGIYDAEKLREVFDIPSEQEVVSVIAVGYPLAKAEPPQRKSIEDIAVFK